MASSETALAAGQRARGLAPFLRSQMRNIAPFLTLIFLSAFFALASPSFIMTLAMMQIAAGISALLVRGQIAYKVPGLITTLGSGSIGGIPWIVIVAAIMLLLGHLVLTYTRFGRYVYMVGGNREAAEYSGLNVKLILGAVMVISAVCSGIGGMLGVAHFGSAQQNERSEEHTSELQSRQY